MKSLVKFTLFTLAAVAALPVFAQGTAVRAESRCRECPFPFKIDKNRWRMPDSNLIIQIEENRLSDGSILTLVTLRTPDSSSVVASGSIRRQESQKEITLTLFDSNGHKVNGEIIWVNYDESVIQARFTCREGECLIPQ